MLDKVGVKIFETDVYVDVQAVVNVDVDVDDDDDDDIDGDCEAAAYMGDVDIGEEHETADDETKALAAS